MNMTTTQAVKLQDTTVQRLKVLGRQRERSPHWLMRKAIEEFLEREEQTMAELQEDERRWDDVVNKDRFVAHDRVEGWLRAWAEGDKRPCPR